MGRLVTAICTRMRGKFPSRKTTKDMSYKTPRWGSSNKKATTKPLVPLRRKKSEALAAYVPEGTYHTAPGT